MITADKNAWSWRSKDGPFWSEIKAGLTPGDEWKELDAELFGNALQIRASRSHVTKSGKLAGETVFVRLNRGEIRQLVEWLKIAACEPAL